MEIKRFLLPVLSPSFLKIGCLSGGGDAESNECQDHGANADMRLRAFAHLPTIQARFRIGGRMIRSG